MIIATRWIIFVSAALITFLLITLTYSITSHAPNKVREVPHRERAVLIGTQGS
jgi:hypothetical protein